MQNEQRVAVITGANRGMGLETARQLAARGYRVVVTARKLETGRAAAATLGADIGLAQLDVTDETAADTLRAWLTAQYGRLDVLVNNAGAFFEPTEPAAAMTTSILTTPMDAFHRSFDTNALGALIVTRALLPLMLAGGYGRVVNVSSGLGSLTTMRRGWPAYRISKAALNVVTQILADELVDTNIKVNAVDPGWVRTDMGGPTATLSVEAGVQAAIRAATLPDDGPTGAFLRADETCPW